MDEDTDPAPVPKLSALERNVHEAVVGGDGDDCKSSSDIARCVGEDVTVVRATLGALVDLGLLRDFYDAPDRATPAAADSILDGAISALASVTSIAPDKAQILESLVAAIVEEDQLTATVREQMARQPARPPLRDVLEPRRAPPGQAPLAKRLPPPPPSNAASA